jgi:hypothetical protein
MNLKVAHLVSIQFGVFIGIVSCLVFSRFEFTRPHAGAEMRKPATERAATVEPMSELEDQASDMMEDAAAPEEFDQFTEQTASAMPTEYSPEAVEKSMAILTKLYYEQIAPRRTVSSSPANTTVAPAYAEVAQEPEVVQYEDTAPQTVAYQQPTQVIVYPQPAQFVVFSQRRRFVSRCRPASPPGALVSNRHRRPDERGTHLNALTPFEAVTAPSSPLRGLTQNRNTGLSSCPPTQGSSPRRTR